MCAMSSIPKPASIWKHNFNNPSSFCGDWLHTSSQFSQGKGFARTLCLGGHFYRLIYSRGLLGTRFSCEHNILCRNLYREVMIPIMNSRNVVFMYLLCGDFLLQSFPLYFPLEDNSKGKTITQNNTKSLINQIKQWEIANFNRGKYENFRIQVPPRPPKIPGICCKYLVFFVNCRFL